MPLKLKKRDGVWHYEGTLLPGDRLRGSTRTANKEIAAQIAAKVESDYWQCHLYGEKEVLTFPQAVAHYLAAGKGQTKNEQLYLARIIRYWSDRARKTKKKETLIRDMTAGAIMQSAIDIHPNDSGATRNRQVITPTQAVINHCAEMELCSPIRIRRFKFERKIKKPIMVDWLDTFCAHARPVTAALATFMFATACRISEARRLEWEDINFKDRSILIQKTKAKKARLPHMPQRLFVALANLPRDGKRGVRPFAWSETRLRIFWDEDIEKAAQAVPGFERLTFHSCRHGFATKLLRDGIDPKTAADLAGMTIGVFLETYAHEIKDARLTDAIFDTPLTRDADQKPQAIEKKG